MNITMTAIIKSQHARLFTQKVIIITERFIYKNPDTFQKAGDFRYVFCIQKSIHLTLRDFHENFELGIYIKNA